MVIKPTLFTDWLFKSETIKLNLPDLLHVSVSIKNRKFTASLTSCQSVSIGVHLDLLDEKYNDVTQKCSIYFQGKTKIAKLKAYF